MLYVVSTPIGNLSDINQRALDTIKKSDFIICEDTRITLKLLSHYSISKPVIRYNEHSQKNLEMIYNLLKSGKNICLITDAGTPCISDPGWKIVKYARDKKIKVEVIGGNSSVIVALAGSGFDGSSFVFLGFLPRSESKIVNKINTAFLLNSPIVIFESPKRIKHLLDIIYNNFGGELDVIIARELTKIHEEWIYGKIVDVIEKIKEREIMGEITVVISKDKIKRKISTVGFVCTGNTCRSVMAEKYAKKIANEKGLQIHFLSSGLWVNDNSTVHENTIKILEKEGIKNIFHKPKQIDKTFIEISDLILTMTKEQKKKLILLFPEHQNKIYTLLEYTDFVGDDIYDPFGKDYISYESVFKQIKKAVDVLIEKLISETKYPKK